MERKDFDHTGLAGLDESNEVNLKEFGFAWIEGETHTIFYYAVRWDTVNYSSAVNTLEADRFYYTVLPNSLVIEDEWPGMEWDLVSEFIEWDVRDEDLELTDQIDAMCSYYGYEALFGPVDKKQHLTYDEVQKGE